VYACVTCVGDTSTMCWQTWKAFLYRRAEFSRRIRTRNGRIIKLYFVEKRSFALNIFVDARALSRKFESGIISMSSNFHCRRDEIRQWVLCLLMGVKTWMFYLAQTRIRFIKLNSSTASLITIVNSFRKRDENTIILFISKFIIFINKFD